MRSLSEKAALTAFNSVLGMAAHAVSPTYKALYYGKWVHPLGNKPDRHGFNHRIKGTEQFWRKPGVEAIMALRALWMSQDLRWDRYWANRSAYGLAKAA